MKITKFARYKLKQIQHKSKNMYLDARWALEAKQFSRQWQERVRTYKWIFVLGCNNSGTTLLNEILARCPAIGTMQLEGQYATRAMPNPAMYQVSRLWTEHLDVFRPAEGDRRYDLPRITFDWLCQIPEAGHVQFIAEKSPPNTVRSLWLQSVFGECYFIGLIRNGYAVAEGIRRREGYSIDRCARHWNVANRVMLDDARQLEHFLLLRYEDFTRDPVAGVDAIADFTSLDRTALRPALDEEFTVHNADGTPSAIRDFNAGSVARLSDEDKTRIAHEAGEMLDQLGYRMP